MMKEKNNFARAVEWLRQHGKIKNQKDLAERIGVTETTITRNKKGNVSHPDDETLHKFNVVFGNIVNIAYLRGESDVMLMEDLQDARINTDVNSYASHNAMAAALLSAKDETIAALRAQLAETTAAKDEIIAAKDALISNLQHQNAVLRAQLTVEKGLPTDGISLPELVERQSCQT